VTVSLLPITITSVTPSATWVPVDTPVTWTTVASGGIPPLQYQFWLLNWDTMTWTIPQPYGPNSVWTFSHPPEGHYRVHVWVRSAGSTTPYEAWTNNTSDVTVDGTENPLMAGGRPSAGS
jgi:hypothetical protein